MTSFKAGQRLTAANLNAALLLSAYKANDQSVTSSTTLVNDNELAIPVAANTTYYVKALVFYAGGTHNTSDFKYNFTYPAGSASPSVRYIGLTPAALAVQYGTVILGGAGAFGTNGTSNILTVDLDFTLITSTTSGTLHLQWAQNTSSGTATTVKAGSSLLAWQMLP